MDFLADGAVCYDTPTDADRHQLLSGFYREINTAKLPDAVGKMKQFACWFTHGVGNGSELRRKVHAARTPNEALESVERFFESRAGIGVDRLAVAGNEGPTHDRDQPACLETAVGA